jgi:hypothetical protein
MTRQREKIHAVLMKTELQEEFARSAASLGVASSKDAPREIILHSDWEWAKEQICKSSPRKAAPT